MLDADVTDVSLRGAAHRTGTRAHSDIRIVLADMTRLRALFAPCGDPACFLGDELGVH